MIESNCDTEKIKMPQAAVKHVSHILVFFLFVCFCHCCCCCAGRLLFDLNDVMKEKLAAFGGESFNVASSKK